MLFVSRLVTARGDHSCHESWLQQCTSRSLLLQTMRIPRTTKDALPGAISASVGAPCREKSPRSLVRWHASSPTTLTPRLCTPLPSQGVTCRACQPQRPYIPRDELRSDDHGQHGETAEGYDWVADDGLQEGASGCGRGP